MENNEKMLNIVIKTIKLQSKLSRFLIKKLLEFFAKKNTEKSLFQLPADFFQFLHLLDLFTVENFIIRRYLEFLMKILIKSFQQFPF